MGTFDLLHPGHVHYLEEAASMGDELHVVVANSETIDHKPAPIVPDEQRRDLVAALDVVDRARVGHPEDYSIPIRAIDPDVLVLGHDQHHDEREVAAMLDSWEIDCRVERASAREPRDDDPELLSSSAITDRILERRAADVPGRPGR
ncbi:adenylyltransferase/cytidyltransferase family protein [Halosolutus gelatinilyticus]|uniref:adenylyltransferase/cytidyltransferase family protein n=1 Tax=Halosolutus gelatinilyticus TaxID=2931975 RepID=UPI001FF502B4|nr:adenylyltransferase/cytidyltransferase family protein [Halosolutus gelatinilyticus]